MRYGFIMALQATIGLIRSEGARDLRTLTATGATSRVRRTLTAATAGALALLGALLGVAGAYVVLTATYYDDLGYLSDVPVLHLALAVIGVPLAATAAGPVTGAPAPRARWGGEGGPPEPPPPPPPRRAPRGRRGGGGEGEGA